MNKKRCRDEILCIRNVCFQLNVSKVKRLTKSLGNEDAIKGNEEIIEYVIILKRRLLDLSPRYVGGQQLARGQIFRNFDVVFLSVFVYNRVHYTTMLYCTLFSAG